MIHLRRHYRPDHIWFADDIFGFHVDWVNEFAAALAAGGGGVPFTIQLRADLVSTAHGRGAARRGLPRSLDRRRERQPEDSRRHEQGHARRENIHARRLLGDDGHPRRLLPAARLSRRGARRHPRHAAPGRGGAPRRRRRQRLLSTARHEVLRGGQAAARRQASLAGEQRPRDDVRRHLSLGVLSRGAQPAARPGDAAGFARGGAALGRAVRQRSASSGNSTTRRTSMPARSAACTRRRHFADAHGRPAAHARLLPRRGREGTADHEAVSAARPAVPVGVSQARGLLGRDLRQHVRRARRA